VRTSISSVFRAGLAACALIVAVLLPAAADAAGLGRMTVLSALGQPLNAEIELNATKDELSTMQVRIANAEAYRRANLEYSAFVASVRVAIEQRRDGSLIIRATTPRAVNDPFIELLVELVWSSGRLMREYTSLIDPPGFTAADVVSPPVAPAAAAKPVVVEPRPIVAAPLAPAVVAAPAAVAPPPAAAEKPAPAARPAAEKPAPRAPRAAAAAAGDAAPAAPGSGEYGPVRRGETLGKIAEAVRPAGVSLDQMLVSLYRENKGAFDGGNMNRLRTGAVLRVPDAAAAGATASGEAAREVRAQAADFNAYRQRVAGAVQDAPPVAAEGGPTASGRIAAKVEEKTPAPAPGSDVLRVSKGDPSKAGGRDPKAAQAAKEEDATAREKSLREANERVASLEKMLKDAQRLLDIQSKQLADLQRLAKADPPKAAEPAKKAEPVKPEPVKPEPAKPEPKPEPKPAPVVPDAKPAPVAPEAKPEPVAPEVKPEPVAPEVKPEPVAPEAPVEAKPPVEAAQPKPVPAPPPPPPPPSFVDQAMAFVTQYMTELGLGLVALLGLGALVARRRKGPAATKAKAAPAAVSAAEPTIMPVPSPTDSLVEPMLSTQAGVEEVDPLAEAEVYLTYGRDNQAEEILREAIAKTPSRHELHLKLLGIYAKRGDAASFETVAKQLHASTGGAGDDWAQAAAMGASIDPSNPLYSARQPEGNADGNMATIAGGAAAAAAAATVAARSIDTEKTQVLTVEDTRPAEAPASIDFDFEPAAPAATTTSAGGDEEIIDIGGSADGKPDITATDMDFTLDFGSPQAASVPELPDLPLEASSMTAETAEVDLAFDPVVAPVAGEAPSKLPEPLFQAQATNVLLDSGPPTGSILDFKLEAARAESASGAAPADGSSPSMMPGLGQDTMIMASPGELVTFDMTHPAGLPQNWQETTLPRVDLDLGETSIDGRNPNKDEHWNDVNTKYDLAKAYEEMGDKDGAREILREVIAEGDEQQKAEAESMLARLG